MKLESKNGRKVAGFKWDEKTSEAAVLLAQGFTRQEVAEQIGKGERTIYRWLSATEFSAEVDRLTCITGIASKAKRLRIAQKVARQLADENIDEVKTKRDLLDWLKYAKSETDGIKLGMLDLLLEHSEENEK